MSIRSKHHYLVASNRKLAKQIWGDVLDPLQMCSLSEITRFFGFSIAMRDILLLEGGWYPAHPGVTDQLGIEGQQAFRLLGIAAGCGFPVEDAFAAIKFPARLLHIH